MQNKPISLNEYYDICLEADISPNYHPHFTEFYFSKLKKRPKIIGKYKKDGRLIAAYPVLFRQIFPNSLQKKLLNQKFKRLGDIGQPEALFPAIGCAKKTALNYLSPVTSPLMKNNVKSLGNYSIKNISIAKKRKHKRLTRTIKKFLAQGGEIFPSDSLDRNDFAQIYTNLFSQNREIPIEELRHVREQIKVLYQYCHGYIIISDKEPKAALLSWKVKGKKILYVQGINYVYKTNDKKKIPYGNILMLSSLRKAEEHAETIGKCLRYSFGYCYGLHDYKNFWADPEPTFIGF
jgi:hypothetical protein